MVINTSNDIFEDERRKAFEAFKLVASQEKRDFVYNLAYRQLVPLFSTAPKEQTERDLILIEGAARLGHSGAALEVGEELYNWAKDNGYHPK